MAESPRDETKDAIVVKDVCKDFVLAEAGKGPVSLWTALKTGDPELAQRRIHALDDISFSVPSGQRLGIIGRNGAGKTTLLSILAGITEPTSGSVQVDGEVHAMLTIGAVLRDEVTGRENIRLDGAIHGKRPGEIDTYEADVIEFSELGRFIDRPVRTYSSGMKARLAFSMGAFVQPDVLIIDETLSVGDAFFSAKATKRMKEVAASGRVVIMVSHGLAAIADMCERCLWMEDGKIVMDGPARDVTKAYERSIQTADEDELARKFEAATSRHQSSDKARISQCMLFQENSAVSGSARAMRPLSLRLAARLEQVESPRLELTVTRVDGRKIFHQTSRDVGFAFPPSGAFQTEISLNPLILGADLYRFEICLFDGEEELDTRHVVCEVTDEEGQFGGVPLLLDPPAISVTSQGRDSK